MTFWLVASALEVYVCPCISEPEVETGPEVLNNPTLLMLLAAVMNELALAIVKVKWSVLDVELVAAVRT